jgi:hypothetical protein
MELAGLRDFDVSRFCRWGGDYHPRHSRFSLNLQASVACMADIIRPVLAFLASRIRQGLGQHVAYRKGGEPDRSKQVSESDSA